MQRAKKKVQPAGGEQEPPPPNNGSGAERTVSSLLSLPEPPLNLALTVVAGRASFGMLLRQRRKQHRLTLAHVAAEIGCQKGYLSMIETGQRPPPTAGLMNRLEKILGFTRGELAEAAHWENASDIVRERFLQNAETRTPQIPEKKEPPKSALFNRARDLDVLLANGSLRQLVEQKQGNLEPVQRLTQRVPIINRVAAGYPTEFTDLDYPARVADDYLACPAEVMDPDAFAARVVGDSMEPEYHEGDTIVFSPNAPTPSGSDCFVRLEPNHDSTFKRIFFEGTDDCRIRLQPLNSAFEERVVAREEVAGMYAAIYVMRRISTPAGNNCCSPKERAEVSR